VTGRARELLLLWVGVSALACGEPRDPAVVELVAPAFDPRGATREWLDTRASDPSLPESFSMRSRRGPTLDAPWRVLDLHRGRDGERFASLLLASAPALLTHHMAAQPGALAADVLPPSRWASVGREAGDAEGALGLLFEPPLPQRGDPQASLAELADADAARVIASALLLGGAEALDADRVPRGADGSARLPFFVPRTGADWSRLSGTLIEVFLPPALGHRLAAETRLRDAVYRELHRRAEAMPDLSAAIEAEAAALGSTGSDVEALLDALATRAEALSGYMNSVWVERLATVVGRDEAQVTVFLSSVAAVRLTGFEADPRDGPVDGMALVDVETGAAAAAQVAEDNRVRFPMARTLHPVLDPTRGFSTLRLDFRLRGLARFGPDPWDWLDSLWPTLDNLATEEPVPAVHRTGFSSLRDPRFLQSEDESLQAFLHALPSRLVGLATADGKSMPVRFDRPTRSLVVPAGRHRVRHDLVLPRGVGLVLEEGAELLVDPGRSILVRGALSVHGSAARPVVVRGAEPRQDWGVLAVQGVQASFPPTNAGPTRVEIRHLRLEGGSSDDLRGAHYAGALSVHHAELVLEHSVLRGARDDGLSVVYGVVEIADSRFETAGGDGADLDWSQGRVRRSLFLGDGSGGDGLELSGSRVSVADSVFERNGRRCLMAAGNARVSASGCLLRECRVAVASRDGSRVEIAASVLLDNDRDFDADRRDGVFGAAEIRGEDLIRAGAGAPDRADGFSRIQVADPLAEGRGLAPNARERLGRATRFSTETYGALRASLP
jgi:hypothetical protein